MPVKVPRVRDRGETDDKVRFASSILPPYLRKARSIEDLLPWLYLKGISTGDFQEALAALPGPNAAGLSSTTIPRLKAEWWAEYERWQRRDPGARRFVHVRADGVCFQPRMAEVKQCVLVLIGADEWGRKEVPGLTDGYRESTRSWRDLLLDLKRRGLTHAPDLTSTTATARPPRSANPARGCGMSSPMAGIRGRNPAARSTGPANGRSGPSGAPTPPWALGSCLGGGSWSEPSPGPAGAGVSPGTGRNPSPPPKPGSTSPTYAS